MQYFLSFESFSFYKNENIRYTKCPESTQKNNSCMLYMPVFYYRSYIIFFATHCEKFNLFFFIVI